MNNLNVGEYNMINLNDLKYILIKDRLKLTDKEAYKYLMKLEESLRAEIDMNNSLIRKMENEKAQ
jgi:hypothetical protein